MEIWPCKAQQDDHLPKGNARKELRAAILDSEGITLGNIVATTGIAHPGSHPTSISQRPAEAEGIFLPLS